MARILFIFLALTTIARADEPATWQRLIEIDELIKVDSPASSALDFPEYWPYGPAWDKLAKASWEQNQPALVALRQLLKVSGEPVWPANPRDTTYLDHTRHISNTLADAALYQHSIGDEAGAFETVNDGLALGRLLRRGELDAWRILIAGCVEVSFTTRAQRMSASVKLTDGGDDKALNVATAKALIQQLLDQDRSPETKKDQLFRQVQEGAKEAVLPAEPPAEAWKRFVEGVNRFNAERTMAAMSLACQLYRHGQGRWPSSIQHLVPAYLPKIPIDPWGDGKQTFGYVLIKAGLPDGGDRPLVYCRCESRDGLFYRIDGPQFHFYYGDGIKRGAERLEGGQFRDVTFWPASAKREGPTTRPLPRTP
jgi:hypothetical protein